MTREKRDWHKLCATVADERDSEKVLELIRQLIAMLDDRKSTVSFNAAEQTAATADTAV